MVTEKGDVPPASNETSSSTVSRMVASRRAPMSSVWSFTRAASRAISRTASPVNSRLTPSVPRSARYWLTRALLGSVRIRTRSSSSRALSSTRIGNRPCSSGMRSVGLLTWNAPAAMKSTWSVRTGPYFVDTVVPSTIGRRSR